MNQISAILAHHHLPHKLEPAGPLQSAANASAIVMIVLVALLCGAILLFALNLRKRSLNPSPESLLLAEVNGDSDYQDNAHRDGRSSGGATKPRQAWEKSDDWWKTPPSNS